MNKFLLLAVCLSSVIMAAMGYDYYPPMGPYISGGSYGFRTGSFGGGGSSIFGLILFGRSII